MKERYREDGERHCTEKVAMWKVHGWNLVSQSFLHQSAHDGCQCVTLNCGRVEVDQTSQLEPID